MKVYKKQVVEGRISYFLPYEERKRLYEKRFHSGVWKKTGEEFDVWLNVFAREQGFFSAVDMLYFDEITSGSLIKYNDYCWTKDSFINNCLYLNTNNKGLEGFTRKEKKEKEENYEY